MMRFGEGAYDNTVTKVRAMTHAKHALTVILDGDRGSGYAVHISGMTMGERIEATKHLVVVVAQLGRALVNGIERLTGMTTEQVMRAMRDVEAAELSPRCPHCGSSLAGEA